jgi:HAD superfamily hydrolase (TIGR01509 family)
MIKCISFDGNGVLYYRDTDFVDELVDYITLSFLPGLDRKQAMAEFHRWMKASFDGAIAKAAAIDGFMDSLGLADAGARRLIVAKELEFSRRIKLFPTERETLLELDARGMPMGMITNSFQSAKEKALWFEAIGLGCAVRNVVSSIDFGASKPDPSIYLEFARRAGVAPGDMAFVGHEDSELRGAERAGMITVSFNCAEGIAADFHLGKFADLLGLVDRQGRARI